MKKIVIEISVNDDVMDISYYRQAITEVLDKKGLKWRVSLQHVVKGG